MIDAERVDFIAVPVSDLSAADEFYGETLGLARNPSTSGDRWVEYETGNLTIGLSLYGGGIALRVADVDAARAELEGAGVEFGMDTFDSGVCNGAPFADPDGNRFLLHRRYAPEEPFAKPATDVKRTDFVGVNVRDRSVAGEFYGGTLGLPQDHAAARRVARVRCRERRSDHQHARAEGRRARTPSPAATSRSSRSRFVSPMWPRRCDRLRAGGVEFQLPEVYDTGVCHMAFFADPDGNALLLHHRYAPYPDGSTP